MPPMYITPDSIIIHNSVQIWYNARIECISSYSGDIFNPVVILHNNVSIQQNLHLTCASGVEIDSNTAISANVTITDIHHPYDNIDESIKNQKIITKKVYIGKECNVGNNVVILPGTYIGNHTTVGANSVLQGTYPDYCVIVGSPAKIIKRYSIEKKIWLRTKPNGDFLD